MENGAQVNLMLSSPGHDRAVLPPSAWRAWVLTDRGPVDPPTAAQVLRPSPMSARVERLLVAAVANDDLDALMHIAGQAGQGQDAARVLAALRLGSVSVPNAVDLLRAALGTGRPTENKILRRHWSDLRIQVALAPSVPALLPLDWTALVLLLAELLADIGRTTEALDALDSAPPLPTTGLARAALLLSIGEHARVLDATSGVTNVDDVSALTLIARSVAARTVNDHATALDAVCASLIDGSRSPAVLAAGLEERAHLYGLTGDSGPARADLEALAAMAAGQTDVPIPLPITLHRLGSGSHDDGEDALARARTRMRRRISAVGEPGHFGGRHHSTYRDEIASMFASGQLVAVEELLLGLLDAVEDEVDELAVALDPTFFLTLADLYEDSGRSEDLHALRERFRAAENRSRESSADDAPVEPVPETLAGLDIGAAAEPATSATAEEHGSGLDRVAPPATPRRGMATPGSVRSGLAAAAALPHDLTVGQADGAGGEGGTVATAERHADPADPVGGASSDEDASVMPTVTPMSDLDRPDPPVATDVDSSEADPDVIPEPEPGEGTDDAPVVDRPARDLTPVERAVRGPRVRSL